MNLGVISRNVGIALICCAVFMFLSALVAALDGFDPSFSPLLLSGILTMMVGIFPLIFVRRHKDINTLKGKQLFLLCAIIAQSERCLLVGTVAIDPQQEIVTFIL